MTLWSRLRAFVRRVRRPTAWERALEDELHGYLDQEIADRVRAGLSPADARRAALATFGGVEQVKERVRDGATGSWLDIVVQDVRSAWRSLRHSRAYTMWVIGSLAVGMAVTIAAFALLNATMLRPFPEVADQKRLVRIAMSRACGRPDCWRRMSSPDDYRALSGSLTRVDGLAAYAQADVAVALPAARSMRAIIASANYFDVLGVRPALGRGFQPSDEGRRAPVALISYDAWTREFNTDPAAVGRSIRAGGTFVEIVGVAPRFFAGIDRARPGTPRRIKVEPGPDIWLPLWLAGDLLPLTPDDSARDGELAFVGRVRRGADVRQVQAEAEVVARRVASARDPRDAARAEALPVRRANPRNWSIGVIVILPIPLLVLLIACVNSANLMLARGSQRQHEIAIRLAIGAGRGRVLRQLMIESAALALAAAAVALPAAWWSLRFASSQLNTPVPIDPTVLAVAVATASLTTLAFGLGPALRVSGYRPSSTLGSAGSRGDAGPAQSRTRKLLVTAQVALSLALLATGSQLVSTVRAQNVSSGTPSDRLLIARFDLEPLGLNPVRIDDFYRELRERAARLPGVDAVGVARHTAIWTFGQGTSGAAVKVWSETDAPGSGRTVSGGYAGGALFEAVGLRVVDGRGFAAEDWRQRPQVALVNRTFARDLSGPALGAIIRVGPAGSSYAAAIDVRVVGVIESPIEPRLMDDGEPPAKVYFPAPVAPEPSLSIYLRTPPPADALAQPLRDLVSSIDARVPVLDIGSLDALNQQSYGLQLWLARAAAALGMIGLLLATAGLYGVSSYTVTMRARELAIRMTIGASPRAILGLVLRQSLRIAATGLVAGGGTAVAVSRTIQSEYHGIVGIDGAVFAGNVAVFLAAMLLAGAIPAMRASRLDPIASLRDG
jgi:predicted permease